MLNCTEINEESIFCNGIKYVLPEEKLTPDDKGFWIYLAVYVGLVLAAGLMSGLTMGLLSLDIMTLKVMKDGGTPTEKRHATKILPIVKRHHLLLVTLLLGNAAAVEAMPIFLDRISDPVTAILVSVTAVLIFGEVIPQAICTRFGLAIGALLAPLVYLLMGLFFIVAWPLSKMLDCLLGKDHSTFYRRAQLKVLVDLHGNPGENQESLSTDEVMIIKGALDMKNKTVKDAMVPLDCVYMLDINRFMDSTTMSEILSQTHSRVPVYDGTRENIVGLLLVKTLIKLDPDDSTPVRTLLDQGMARQVLRTPDDRPLFDMLNEFQEGKGHLAIVQKFQGHTISMETEARLLDDNPRTPLLSSIQEEDDDLLDIRQNIVGIITLEDVLEELIQEEIVDETDVYVDIKRQIQVARAKAAKPPGSGELFDIEDQQQKSMRSMRPRRSVRRSASHPPLARLSNNNQPDLVTIADTHHDGGATIGQNEVFT